MLHWYLLYPILSIGRVIILRPSAWKWFEKSRRTLHAQIARLSAPKARDSIVALRTRSYIFRMHIGLFLVIWYWSSSQFFNIVDVNHIFSNLLNLFLVSNEKEIQFTSGSISLNPLRAVGRIRFTCFFAVFQAFLIHFTLFSAQVFDFRLKTSCRVIIMINCLKLLINNLLWIIEIEKNHFFRIKSAVHKVLVLYLWQIFFS